jgi:outer membrane cobalamin receptor
MRRSRTLLAAAVALVVAGGAGSADEPSGAPPEAPTGQAPDDRPVFFTEILVTPERGSQERGRTPAATEALDPAEIQRLPAQNLAELLAFVPGFQVVSGAAFGAVPIVTSRGFFGAGEAEYVQLLVDGVPVNDVESGLADWQGIAASELSRVEALRGPGASFYGDAAIGGVVQVFTRRSGSPGSHLELSGGSFGSLDLGGGVRRSLGSFGLGASGALLRTDGAREHSGREQAQLGLFVDQVRGSSHLRLDLSGLSRDRDEPGPLAAEEAHDPDASSPFYRFDREERLIGRAALSYSWAGRASGLRGTLLAASRDGEAVRTQLLAAGVPDRALRTLATRSFSLLLDGERRFAWHAESSELRGGLELTGEDLDTDYSTLSETGAVGDVVAEADATRRRLGAFISAGSTAFSRLRLTAGMRYDRVEERLGGATGWQVHEAWSPRIGATLRLGDPQRTPTSLFVSLSRAFKVPTLDQLFDPRPYPDFQGGSFRVSNPELRPQRARNLELGMSGGSRRHRWEALGYLLDIDDEIDFDVATYRYANIAESRHVGLEVEGRLFVDGAVSPALSYAWSRVRARGPEGEGRQLKNVPEHVLRPSLSVAISSLRLELRYTWLAERYLDDENLFPLQDAKILDLRLSAQHGPLRADLDLLNLTDDRSSAYGFVLPDLTGGEVPYLYPLPGFGVRLGLSLEL